MAVQPNQKHLDIALHHARIIQHRKDVENKIFECLEKLIDYPLSENAQPESPSDSEAAEVTRLLQLFSPSDFEDLVDERRMADRCGYPLCPRPPAKQKSDARYRIIRTSKGNGVSAVPKEKFESWCSPACTQRSVFLKRQLSGEPAWARKESYFQTLSYPVGNPKDGKTISPSPQPLAKNESSTDEDISEGMTKLALRPKPDQENSSEDSTQILRPKVVERESINAPEEPQLEDDDPSSGAIEGYTPGGDVTLDRKDLTNFFG
jgi:RNA polymerase II-associated protein 2